VGRLFGTDGVRGLAGAELSGDLAYRLGGALVASLIERGEERPQVAVGRDTRASGELLEAALCSGICSAGGDAVLLGVTPTPAVAYLTVDLGATAGAVISASHNPAEYNGIKFFSAVGYKLQDEMEDEIESLQDGDRIPRASGRGLGRIFRFTDADERYLRHLESSADGGLEGMRVVVDCANGAASRLAPEALSRLGAEAVPIHNLPDGWNINRGCGATSPEVVALAVADAQADAGVTHDGDADRALFADREGGVIDGDQVLAALALDMDHRGELENRLLVTTVMANLGLRLAMEEAGIKVVETRVGDRYVLEEMLRTGAVLGGEQSGHIVFLHHATTGDGLLTAIQFLAMARRNEATVAEMAASMKRYPQVLTNVPVSEPSRLDASAEVWAAVREAERELGPRGRVLVRASGTEPLVRVMVESESTEEAHRHAEAIAGVVRATLSRA
jgi:phosphoglucosamine mutase